MTAVDTSRVNVFINPFGLPQIIRYLMTNANTGRQCSVEANARLLECNDPHAASGFANFYYVRGILPWGITGDIIGYMEPLNTLRKFA